jgi:hypothetical protein
MKSSISGAREAREVPSGYVRHEKRSRWEARIEGATLQTTVTREAVALLKRRTSEYNLALWGRPLKPWRTLGKPTYKEEGLRRFYKNVDEAQGESHLA